MNDDLCWRCQGGKGEIDDTNDVINLAEKECETLKKFRTAGEWRQAQAVIPQPRSLFILIFAPACSVHRTHLDDRMTVPDALRMRAMKLTRSIFGYRMFSDADGDKTTDAGLTRMTWGLSTLLSLMADTESSESYNY